MAAPSTIIIITMVLGALVFILSIALASLWLFMGDEGRFFFKRKFDNKGIDVIRHEPLSNRLRLITVKWNGLFFQYKNEMLFFGMDKLLNPDSDPKRYFNEVVGRMCTWAGSKRPVLIATDTMSHLITPDLLALAAKSRKIDNYTKIKGLKNKFDDDPLEKVTYLETIKPDDLTEFMEDISARDAMQSYDTGKRVAELERAKTGMQLGSTAKIVLSLTAIGAVALIIYLVATGKLDSIINSFQR